jgi:hypothetical protein
MAEKSDRPTADQDAAFAAAIAAGCTIAEAAAAAGFSERTGHRRIASNDIRGRVARVRAQILERASGLLSEGMAESANVLRALLKSESEGVRLKAAVEVFKLGLATRDQTDLAARMEEIERRLTKQGAET